MRVVAVVPLIHLRRLREALTGMAEVVPCGSRSECERALTSHRADVLVVGPSLLQDPELDEFLGQRLAADILTVYYVPLKPSLLSRLIPLVSKRSAEVLIADLDDTGSHIRSVFARLPSRSVQADLLASAAPLLMRLTPAVAAVLMAVILDPERRSTKELSARVGVSRRTVDRALVHQGFSSLRLWCSVAALTWSFAAFEDAAVGEAVTAYDAGYVDARAFRRALEGTLRLSSLAELRQLTREEFVAAATRALQRR